jgi:hypothetical protein
MLGTYDITDTGVGWAEALAYLRSWLKPNSGFDFWDLGGRWKLTQGLLSPGSWRWSPSRSRSLASTRSGTRPLTSPP